MELVQALCACFLASLAAVSGQSSDCPMLRQSELGDNTTMSATGLLAEALSAGGQGSNVNQLLQYKTVCLGQGTVRDTYRTTSLVVSYLDSTSTEMTMQLHLQCGAGSWNIAYAGSVDRVLTATNSTLSTPLRTDCLLCLAPGSGIAVSTEEHCSACPADCLGLTRCHGIPSNPICCNFFDMTGSCVTTCPANSSPNAQFECECDSGYSLVNGSTCVEEVTECDPSPCLNGGTCTDSLDTSSCACDECQCGDGWEGPDCSMYVCSIENCLECVGMTARCTNCSSGYAPSPNGSCEQLCSSQLSDCLTCSPSGERCTQCANGFILTNGRCELPCEVASCVECSQDKITCTACARGSILNPRENICEVPPEGNLDDIQVIAVIMGCIVAAVLATAVVAVAMCWVYYRNEGPKMDQAIRANVLHDYVHGRSNPAYMKPEEEEVRLDNLEDAAEESNVIME